MRINIIGPSGSGKTYLARRLSQKMKIKVGSLDYIFFKYSKDAGRIELPEQEWRNNLQKFLEQQNWIIEGINPVLEIFDRAEVIVFLRPSFSMSLFGQWYRFFTDPVQRKEYGLVANLDLTRYLIRQYFQSPDWGRMDDEKYFRVKKVDYLLAGKYRNKSRILTSKREVNDFVNSITGSDHSV